MSPVQLNDFDGGDSVVRKHVGDGVCDHVVADSCFFCQNKTMSSALDPGRFFFFKNKLWQWPSTIFGLVYCSSRFFISFINATLKISGLTQLLFEVTVGLWVPYGGTDEDLSSHNLQDAGQ